MNMKKIIATGMTTACMTLAGLSAANAAPRVSIEAMLGETETAQTLNLETKAFGAIGGKLDYFLKNRTPIETNNYVSDTAVDNAVGPSMTFVDINYELLKGLDAVLAAKLTTGFPAEARVGVQYAFSKDGFMFYTLATRKLNENPNTEWKFDLVYNEPMSASWGWRANWEESFTIPDDLPATNTSRFRIGATYTIPDSGTVVSFGPAVDINNIQNGEDAKENPRTVMRGAYVSLQFK